MYYREMGKTGDKISILGYGCMRFPRSGGRVDEKRAERQVLSAIDRGVNYLDTAYLYFGNEAIVGNIVANGGCRDKILLATKLPPAMVSSRRDMEKMLDTQLERLKTDRIDYYLMHMLTSMEGWERLKQFGVEAFLEAAKRSGKIRRAAFSFHGPRGEFKKIIDDYPWDMAQIQYNYFDEHNQAGREGLEYAASKNIGVVVMEPLRGGSLVNKLPKQVHDIFDAMPVKRTPAEWGLRWIWDQPGVTALLSGMNDESQIDENIRIASEALPNSLSDEEKRMFERVKAAISASLKVPCTGCAYCMPCPAGVNIPACFALYNDKYLHSGLTSQSSYLARMGGIDGSRPSYASLCKNCGACEKKCPQALPIRQHLKDVSRDMEKFYFKPVTGAIRGYYKIKDGFKKTSGAK